VIVSNYLELRLYHASDQSKYERFELSRLTETQEMKRLLFLMHRDNLLPLTGNDADGRAVSRTEELFAQRVKEEDRITKEFYAEYKQARNDLFKHLCAANPSTPELLVLNKTQKLLDRVIFVCFVEDKEIIPRRTFRRLLEDVKRDKFNRSDTKIWDRVRGLFAAINEGYPEEHINKFNGGLFADDAELDALVIKDSVLEHIIALEKYDFDSDLNVNILGHIFEQSISDIEELKASIEVSIEANKGLQPLAKDTTGKRKKDGIFYTPEYITRYIVQETVGGYLEERKQECGFGALPELTETDWQSIKLDRKNVLSYNKTVEAHIKAWTAYREKLAAIKVCDPACGSGAFLNQVFDFLYAEGQRVNAELARLQLGQTTTSDLQKDILQNNLYGVDVNPESVEITRLSLWLKTANRSRELTSLDHTIRCGNSLVDDPNVAGEKAFDWAAAFPEVFGEHSLAKDISKDISKGLKPLVGEMSMNKGFQPLASHEQNLQAYHITWVTHNSRVSERMIEHEAVIKHLRTNKGLQPLDQPLEMDEDMEHNVLELLCGVIKEKGLRVLALNICCDHVHCVLVCQESERDTIVQQMKGKTTFLYKKAHAISGEFHLWAQKYHFNVIESEQELYAVMRYVEQNRLKHELSEGKGLKPLVQRVLTPLDQAFTPIPNKGLQPLEQDKRGGFDVIVGNPPYVRQELLPEAMKAFLAKNYTVAHGSADLYAYFMERSVNFLKDGGLYSIIVANKWMRASYGEPLRRWIKTQSLEEILDFGDLPVFEDAIAYPCVLRIRKSAPQEEFRAANITTLDFESLAAEVERTRFAVRVAQLQDEGWSLANKVVSDVLAKLRAAGTPLGEYVQGKIYRGVLTGLNEAFVVDAATRARLIAEDPRSADVLKPFLAGRDVKRYATPEAESYLILFPKGWTRQQFSAVNKGLQPLDPASRDDNESKGLKPLVDEREAWEWLQSAYPAVSKHLVPFADAARKRSDKGEYWWELRACEYYEEFEKPKMLLPDIAQRGNFMFDEQGFYCVNTAYILPIDDKALMGILNSRAITFFYEHLSASVRGGYLRFIYQYLVQLPIPPFATRGLSPLLSSHAETMLTTTRALADLRKRVLTLLLSKTGIQKASTKLQEWDALTWAELEAEINKGLKPLATKGGKSKLSLNDQEELLTYFEQKKAEAERLKTTLAATDRAIDALVYGLYGLTAEEIAVVEGRG
jgi:type I restriction-modification system DNA methylase subunit/REP element-mobilizing transposase RayT